MTQPSGGYDEARLKSLATVVVPVGTYISTLAHGIEEGRSFTRTPVPFTKTELAQTQHRISTLSALLQLYQHLQHLRYSLSFCFIFLPSKTCSLERHVRYLDALSCRRLNAAVINLAVFLPLLVIPSLAVIVSSPLRFHLSSVRLFTKG